MFRWCTQHHMARAQCHLSDVQPLFPPTIFSLRRCCLDTASTTQPSFQNTKARASVGPDARCVRLLFLQSLTHWSWPWECECRPCSVEEGPLFLCFHRANGSWSEDLADSDSPPTRALGRTSSFSSSLALHVALEIDGSISILHFVWVSHCKTHAHGNSTSGNLPHSAKIAPLRGRD